MAAPADLLKLVDQFRANRETYLSDAFNETALRLQFIDPMFELLGWDVYNRQGYAEAYKDVVHEDSLKIGSSTKAPDYSFRIGGARKFFVEAKKPSVNIGREIAPAFQLRRYAWSAKLPLSVLTDFEEFAVYDCRVRPEKTDSPSTARTLYLTYDQYADRWDEIAAIFSREAVLKGAFDRYAESARKKRGTAEVDAAFLDEIEQWRAVLARNLALRNPQLSQRDLNFAVQKTIELVYDPDASIYVTDAMYVFRTVPGVDPWAFMAIMQSRLFFFLYRTSNQGESRVIPQVKASKLDSLPFPTCDKPQPALTKLRERCRQMYELCSRQEAAQTPHEQTTILRQLGATEVQIDRLVYRLYGLTDAEIRIVEESTSVAAS